MWNPSIFDLRNPSYPKRPERRKKCLDYLENLCWKSFIGLAFVGATLSGIVAIGGIPQCSVKSKFVTENITGDNWIPSYELININKSKLEEIREKPLFEHKGIDYYLVPDKYANESLIPCKDKGYNILIINKSRIEGLMRNPVLECGGVDYYLVPDNSNLKEKVKPEKSD